MKFRSSRRVVLWLASAALLSLSAHGQNVQRPGAISGAPRNPITAISSVDFGAIRQGTNAEIFVTVRVVGGGPVAANMVSICASEVRLSDCALDSRTVTAPITAEGTEVRVHPAGVLPLRNGFSEYALELRSTAQTPTNVIVQRTRITMRYTSAGAWVASR